MMVLEEKINESKNSVFNRIREYLVGRVPVYGLTITFFAFGITALPGCGCGDRITTVGWVNIISPSDSQELKTTEVEVIGKFGGFPKPREVKITAKVGEGKLFSGIITGEDYSVILKELPQDDQTLTVVATDGIKEASATVTIRVDTVPPEVEINSPYTGTMLESLKIPIKGTASDATSVVEVILVNGVEATGPPFAPGIVGSWSATLENQPQSQLTIQATATDGMGWSNSDLISIVVSYPPVLLGPGGEDPYGIIDPANGSICYDVINGIDCTNPDNEIDFGVPGVGDFGIGTARNFRPGDKVTLPINANIGDNILLAWTINLEYNKDILINPMVRESDKNLPPSYYTKIANSSGYNFKSDEPDEPAILLCGYISNTGPMGQKNLANLTFTISENALPGYYPVYVNVEIFEALGERQESSGTQMDGVTPLEYVTTYSIDNNPISGLVKVVP
ncbi:MAG: hypothetical protein JSU92_04805 [Deltaproteobacteria bacterium]|nr:MAG: hypothetical protein JSU92_04805 [Deltaproteobacteria bacterium]